jgi:hypothetical protein
MSTPGRGWRASTRLAASAASAQDFNELANMRLTSKHGSTLNERGTATGTYAFSPITMIFTSVSGERGVATLTGYVHTSSLSGRATVSYYTSGVITHFEGSMTITSGTGTFAHAHSHSLRIKGYINRHDFNTYAHASGKLEL